MWLLSTKRHAIIAVYLHSLRECFFVLLLLKLSALILDPARIQQTYTHAHTHTHTHQRFKELHDMCTHTCTHAHRRTHTISHVLLYLVCWDLLSSDGWHKKLLRRNNLRRRSNNLGVVIPAKNMYIHCTCILISPKVQCDTYRNTKWYCKPTYMYSPTIQNIQCAGSWTKSQCQEKISRLNNWPLTFHIILLAVLYTIFIVCTYT